MLNKIRKTEEITDPEGKEEAVQLIAQEAPEPVPERKTSDEMITLMAESALGSTDERTADPAPESSDERMADPPPEICDDREEKFVPELDEWTEEPAPDFEDETDGIKEE